MPQTGGVQLTAALAILLAILPGTTALAQQQDYWLYRSRPGDTIWDLSRRHLREWRRWPELQALNGIADPQRVPPGRLLRFPVAWLLETGASASVEAVVPPVTVSDADGSRWARPLLPEATIEEGSRVTTGPAGSATLGLADGARLLVPADTTLVLTRLRRFAGTPLASSGLRLERGPGGWSCSVTLDV